MSPNVQISYNITDSFQSRYATYPKNRSDGSITSYSIVQAGIDRAKKALFVNNFVPWKFHPRNFDFEPSANQTRTYIHNIVLQQTSIDSGDSYTPLAGQVDESYTLSISTVGNVSVSAPSYIGILHGLETLTQLFYQYSDEDDEAYTTLAPVHIIDAPQFSHRGLNMDVARNYYRPGDIMRTIDALAWNKFNRLHLHVTDAQSWPLEIPALPDLAGEGAYRTGLSYTPAILREIQEYGICRGIEVIVEVDMPGHTSSIGLAYPHLITAFSVQPNWDVYAAEPPSGQLKLNSSAVDDFLTTMFNDLLPRISPYSAYFHTGGDEVNANAYLLDETIQSNDSLIIQPYLQRFVDRNHDQLRAAGLTPIVWEEMLLEWNITLGPDVLVQTWQSNEAVAQTVAKGHKALVGNYQYWYLDCGKGQWLDFYPSSAPTHYPFTDYCSPYKNWRLMYSYDPLDNIPSEQRHLVLGGEVHIWSEQTDPVNLDDMVWPRTSAAGEVLWSGAKDAQGQNRSQIEASPRLAEMRERMVAKGVKAGPVQMIYCTQYAERRDHEAKDIAVLGGGITGLASAFYLSKELPHARVTIYEGSSRLGGWLHTKHVDVGSGNIIFEQGPRTLRPSLPNGYVTLDLVRQLKFEDRVLMTSKQSVAARNRFIYYPDHLVRVPGPGVSLLENLASMFTSPLLQGIPSALAFEFMAEKRPSNLEDESVGSFISRRFSPALADNIVSAVLHGIYAGDVYKLSIKSLQPLLWEWEGKYGSITSALLNYPWFTNGKLMLLQDAEIWNARTLGPILSRKLKGISEASVYTFKGGLGELADKLEEHLRQCKNVTVKTDSKIAKIKYIGQSEGIKITTQRNQPPATHTHAISTLSSRALSSAAAPSLPSLTNSNAVTVMVVNFYFSNPDLLPVHGFGYLIPRSVPYEQNPERALGVVFDSDATIGQDTVAGTKVTVMLGGHWWDGWSSYPDEEQGAAMAKSILARHLKITAKPDFINVGLQKECIPQYIVGHETRMKNAHRELEKEFKGRLRVAGNSYTGVGLNDCVRAARDVVVGLVEENGEDKTGLGGFLREKRYVRAISE
ncbi:MAG: N-acetyl-glucosamine-6-phosphate deacetylase [Pycnora praestabilis]|nr:MAG: N-acetyl-glucosamine-6-phosphate deacetylase [Pycnora praestabilis]